MASLRGAVVPRRTGSGIGSEAVPILLLVLLLWSLALHILLLLLRGALTRGLRLGLRVVGRVCLLGLRLLRVGIAAGGGLGDVGEVEGRLGSLGRERGVGCRMS